MKNLHLKKSRTILPLSSEENTGSSKSRIIFAFLHLWLSSQEMKMDWGEEILTEDFYIDGRLCLFVSTGSNTLVGPSIFIPSFVECEGGGWVIVTGYRYVWSVRLYSVPTRAKPVYVLGRAINYCRSKRKKAQKKCNFTSVESTTASRPNKSVSNQIPPYAWEMLMICGGNVKEIFVSHFSVYMCRW